MKRILLIITVIFMSLGLLACDKEEKMTMLVPSGMPLVAVGGALSEFNALTTDGAALLKTELMATNYNVIVAPVNLGASLYNAGKLNYKLAKVITQSNVYIVSRVEDKLDSIADLEGQTIYSYGDGQPADKVLKYVISKSGVNAEVLNNGIDSVATVVQSYFVNKTAKYILCAEPYVSNIRYKLGIDINVLDLSEVAKSLGADSLSFVPQACVYLNVNNTEKENTKILKLIEGSINSLLNKKEKYVSNLLSMNKEEYPLFTNLGEDILLSLCDKTKIDSIDANQTKEDIKAYLALIGINLKDDELFYDK